MNFIRGDFETRARMILLSRVAFDKNCNFHFCQRNRISSAYSVSLHQRFCKKDDPSPARLSQFVLMCYFPSTLLFSFFYVLGVKRSSSTLMLANCSWLSWVLEPSWIFWVHKMYSKKATFSVWFLNYSWILNISHNTDYTESGKQEHISISECLIWKFMFPFFYNINGISNEFSDSIKYC